MNTAIYNCKRLEKLLNWLITISVIEKNRMA